MKNFLVFLLSCLFALSACDKVKVEYSDPTVFGNEASISWQSCVNFADHSFTICFIDAEEYRCPCYAECIWEGAVNATFHITSQAGLDTVVVLTTNSNPVNLHNSEVLEGKTVRFLRTDGLDQGCADYGNYQKYKAVVQIE